jgi:hypothetical protein
MKREIEGVLVRERDQPAIKDEDGKVRLVYNLFDGLTGKKIKLIIEEVKEPEEEEIGEQEIEEPAEEAG